MTINNRQLTIDNSSPSHRYLTKTRYLIATAVLLFLATFLRFYLLDNQSFWNDEGNSARLSERSIRLIIEGTASDIHPPLYYLMLRGWRELVGETEFGLRALSTFGGILTVAMTMALARRMTRNRVVALLAGLITAVHPALVYYSQEARMYSLLGLWSVLATLLLWVWLERLSWSVGLAYVLVGAAGLYTHYFFPVVLSGHVIFILAWFWIEKRAGGTRPYGLIFGFGGMVLGMVLLYAPWIPTFLQQFGDEPIVRPAFWPFVQRVGQWLFVGGTFSPIISTAFVVVLLVLLGSGLLWQRPFTQKSGALLLGTAVILPILFNFALGTTDDPFLKFYIVALPMLAILLAGVWLLPKVGWLLGLGLLLWLLPNTWASLQQMYFSPEYVRADYRSMAQRIKQEAHPNAGIILDAPNQWEAFTYYYPDEGNVYPLPKGQSRPTEAEIDTALTDISTQHDRLYAIFWGEAQRDPERLVERWLDANAFKATDEWVGDVRFVTYAVPSEPAAEMETAVANITFDNKIQLLGYTLEDDTLLPGDIVQITLFWQAVKPIDLRYKVFLHILDESGNLVAQRDSEPGGGLAITPGWVPEMVVRDNHGILLPTGTLSGRYRFRVGLYELGNPNNRLMVESELGSQDSFALPELTVGK